MEEQVAISGTVAACIYQNEENGYTVIRLHTADGQVTAVGCMPFCAPGEEVVLTGSWVNHPAYGSQFKAEFVERHMPTGVQGIYAYLASGAIRGVGKATARLIVDKFGAESLAILESQPRRLAEIRGISLKKALEIGDNFRRQVGLRRLIEFFVSYDLPPLYALRMYKQYGDDAMAALQENPYLLAEEAVGGDFAHADGLALDLGFAPDCAQRLRAALLFELSYNLNNGHAFIPRDKLIGATAQLLEGDWHQIASALEELEQEGAVVTQPVAGETACYLERLYRAEASSAQRILALAAKPAAQEREVQRILRRIEEELGIQYSAQQRRAVSLAGQRQILVLTGGPGTGKTTSVRGILALFEEMGLEVALAAPTGRAAKRLAELTGREAQTIHRLLEAAYVGERGETVFQRNADDPLEVDALILDEASMVDILLLDAVLEAMPPDCRLILVGDADQLPSVGPGNVLRDILRSGAVEAVRLTEIFRQAEESNIVKNAHRINGGQMPDLSNTGDFFFLNRSSSARTVETVLELCAQRLPKNMGFDPWQIQVLSPSRKYETGVTALNQALQQALNPAMEGKNEKTFGEFTYREGDKVMQIRNNYDIIWRTEQGTAGKGVFNGDIGQIIAIDLRGETVTVLYDEGRLVAYSFDMLGELEPAYALTVHKAQGSEYEAVVLAAFGGPPALLTRGLLYTAVTRAKKLLIIVGDGETLAKMVANDRQLRRYSGLRARLSGEA